MVSPKMRAFYFWIVCRILDRHSKNLPCGKLTVDGNSLPRPCYFKQKDGRPQFYGSKYSKFEIGCRFPQAGAPRQEFALRQIDGRRQQVAAPVLFQTKKTDDRKFAVVRLFGGDSRGRTGDLLNAIQALYQLSYTPTAII